MNILLYIIIVLAGIIALLLLIAIFMRKQYRVQREIIIQSPSSTVFDYLRQLKNQDNFNKWVMADPDMKKDFKGTDGTVGFIYGWNGNKKAGEGEQEITALEEGKRIKTEVRFIRPFPGIAYADMIMEPISNGQTKLSWCNTSAIKYPMNMMIPMIEKMLAKDMDTSLQTLKNILEK